LFFKKKKEKRRKKKVGISIKNPSLLFFNFSLLFCLAKVYKKLPFGKVILG